MAAAAHSSISNVVVRSSSAVGQSAGVGETDLIIVNGATQMGGVVMSVGSTGLTWVKARF